MGEGADADRSTQFVRRGCVISGVGPLQDRVVEDAVDVRLCDGHHDQGVEAPKETPAQADLVEQEACRRK